MSEGLGPNERGQSALVTIHLPMDATAVVSVQRAVSRRYKDAVVGSAREGKDMVIFDRPPRPERE